MLIDNNVRHYSFFGVEQANWDNFTLEGGVRVENKSLHPVRQSID